jgi:hypothetical protein
MRLFCIWFWEQDLRTCDLQVMSLAGELGCSELGMPYLFQEAGVLR